MSEMQARLTQYERSARTREKLVAAATEALYRFGYAATSTTLVAELAGVSRGAMVHQFPTKVELMAAVARSTYDADIDAYRAALAGQSNAIDQMVTLIDVAWRQFSGPGGVAQTEIWMATRSDAELALVVVPLHDEITAATRDAHARLLRRAGWRNARSSDALLALNIAALRGLAMERALGAHEAVLQRSVDMMKRHVRSLLASK
jgi:AcrR family transcriptional regulator